MIVSNIAEFPLFDILNIIWRHINEKTKTTIWKRFVES